MLSNLEAALPDRWAQRDETNTLSGDLAALFELDMAEGEAPAAVPPAAASAGSRKKSNKSAKTTRRSPAR
jgi:hypothetical protein